MKNILTIALAIVIAFTFVACTTPGGVSKTEPPQTTPALKDFPVILAKALEPLMKEEHKPLLQTGTMLASGLIAYFEGMNGAEHDLTKATIMKELQEKLAGLKGVEGPKRIQIIREAMLKAEKAYKASLVYATEIEVRQSLIGQHVQEIKRDDEIHLQELKAKSLRRLEKELRERKARLQSSQLEGVNE